MVRSTKSFLVGVCVLAFVGTAVAQDPYTEAPAAHEPEPVEQLANSIREDLEKQDDFSGAVLVAKDGESIFTAAYGLARQDDDVSNRVDTQFRIGSMNKMFTAVAVLTLVQAGRLDLNDPIGKYLPDYPNPEVASTVTVHHLLTHTGGTGDTNGDRFTADGQELRKHEDYVSLFGARDVLFEPGSQFSYSNYGFVLLGAVIERVSGDSYYDYVRAHVYEPAGMTSTNSSPRNAYVENQAVGYTKRGILTGFLRIGGGRPNTDNLPFRGTAAGGGYSTVEDLLRFANALENHTLLNEYYTELLLTPMIDLGSAQYAYGFGYVTVNGMTVVGHNGGAPGMNGILHSYPASGYVVAVLANQDPPSAQNIADIIANRLPH